MKADTGTDIAKRKCDCCIVDGGGRVLERGQYPNTEDGARQAAERMARTYGGGCRAACETTASLWNTTFDAFEEAGIKILPADTYRMALIAKTAKKTDKVDAEKIANILRMGTIPECYVPPAGIRGVRAMVREGVRTAWDRTRVTNRVHSLPGRNNLTIDASEMHAKKAIAQMEDISLKSVHDEIILHRHARQIRHMTEETDEMDRMPAGEAAQNEDAGLPAGMTGMGVFFSLLLAVGTGAIGRFDSPKQMVSWAGLCPVVYQSGDKLYAGRIKKPDTNGLVNWAMCEAADVAIRHDARMEPACLSARKRHAGRHAPAIIVVAHKMISMAWHMLKTRTPYESRNMDLYRRKPARMERARRG